LFSISFPFSDFRLPTPDSRFPIPGSRFLSRGQQVLDNRLGLLPFTPERGQDNGVNDEFNVRHAGEMRAELRPLRRIEAALEEGAEDGGIDGAPVER
jgi:hypothetical protein